ncbi:DUF4160 domain-containing protein [Tistrella mobilis]
MPTIVRFGNLKVQMFADDHNPPHFHLLTPDYEALIKLADFSVIAGRIDGRSYEIATRWAANNRELLAHEWERLNQR